MKLQYNPALCGWIGEDDRVNQPWTPAVNVQESKDAYTIEAELPGVSKEDIAISLEENVLTLSGERKAPEQASDRRYTHTELAQGKFFRSFRLPSLIEPAGISANSQNGVLKIEIPKSEAVKPRSIQVN